ncbi:uncharacterized protein LOC114408348 [Glycine soja]|uniref:uncharacterized protein LOC114408348 n=1 Tax=Glycine soja TaxID=3848 RepID=UPI00103F09E9|nr:uncharacterized protein LOC114408348 [Glycine soja]
MKGLTASPYQTCIDALTITNVCWMPYGDHRGVRAFDLISCFQGQLRWGLIVVTLRPKRMVRQFGYIQTIPPPPISATLSYKDINDRWMPYSDHLAVAGDQPRHPPIPQHEAYLEQDISEVPVAVEGGPSQDACEAIAERLERVLNLRMVTEGTKLHEIMEDCRRITKGVTSDGNVYVRAR